MKGCHRIDESNSSSPNLDVLQNPTALSGQNWGESIDQTAVGDPESTSVAGIVKRVVFRNDENGFSVLTIEARGHIEPISVIGLSPEFREGESITATGKWETHKRFGRQFTADLIHATLPETTQGMQRYLSSRAIDGIGEVYAKQLVKTFGDKLFNVIEFEPERLQEVEGIGKKRAAQIKQAWDRHRSHRDAMLFLHEHGIGAALGARIYRTYSEQTIKIVAENPYRLSRDIRGVGFKTADALAAKVGFESTDIRRVRAGLVYLASEAADKGSCGVYLKDLIEQATEILQLEEDLARQGVEAEFADRGLVQATIDGEECAMLPDLYRAEQIVANRLRQLKIGTPSWKPIDVERAIPWVERESRLSLGASQSSALKLALGGKFTIVTGGPGVGKTTIVNAILRILTAVKVKIKLCAPTGRAARRLSEATKRSSYTIHRLLHFDMETGAFRYNRSNPLKCDLLVVDEASMIDAKLMSSLLQAVPDTAAVILVGDVDQLPSVGPGQVLGDIISSESVPVVRLVEVFRQAKASRIILNAHRINAGQSPNLSRPDKKSDFYFVPAELPEEAVAKVLKLVCDRIPDRFGLDPIQDTQVLCPMIRGSVGVQMLNEQLQLALNPNRQDQVERFGRSFVVGDKVMQTHNNYEVSVFNGDIGYVTAVRHGEELLEVDFDGRVVELEFNDLDGIMPAYAVTIHKSQGSEFPAVVLPIMNQHYVMLKRKLLYTGVTRGKRLVVLVGQSSAIQMAVREQDSQNQRLSRLKNLLI